VTLGGLGLTGPRADELLAAAITEFRAQRDQRA
jgi:hypothetical protein